MSYTFGLSYDGVMGVHIRIYFSIVCSISACLIQITINLDNGLTFAWECHVLVLQIFLHLNKTFYFPGIPKEKGALNYIHLKLLCPNGYHNDLYFTPLSANSYLVI